LAERPDLGFRIDHWEPVLIVDDANISILTISQKGRLGMCSIVYLMKWCRDIYIYIQEVMAYWMRKVTWFQTPTVLWVDGGIISPSCSTCMGLRMLGRQKYTEQNH
jgi:hypothetical protein